MRVWLVVAGLSGAMAVILGAVGSHVVGANDSEAARLIDKAARYQIMHAVALVGVAALNQRQPHPLLSAAAILFVAGTVLFCGTLYGTAFGFGFGPLAPIGGLAFVFGWLALAGRGLVKGGGM